MELKFFGIEIFLHEKNHLLFIIIVSKKNPKSDSLNNNQKKNLKSD